MEKQEKGYVYILTNPSFREDWVKIGKSMRPVDVRSKELDNTAVPLPFQIYATIQTAKYNEVEKMVHKMIDKLNEGLRVRKNREFFNVTPEKALSIFYDIKEIVDDAVITVYKDNKPIAPQKVDSSETEKGEPVDTPKRSRFKFSMVGIPIGEMITFVPTGIQVRIANDDTVEYEGRIYKLSPFVGTFMPEDKRNHSGAYQGAKFFSYKGKILDELRLEIEAQQSNTK